MNFKAINVVVMVGISFGALAFSSIPPNDHIPFNKAKETALAECPGKIATSEFGKKGDYWIFTFEIKATTDQSCVVSVDAVSGGVKKKIVDSGKR
jgi:uncharacterized membrane protein YkoI